MSTASTHDVTRLLQAWRDGNREASAQLLPLIYEDLRRLAREYMRREGPGHTLQATVLVHEAYLRLAGGAPIEWQGRAHFYSLAARAMRRILVDHARARQRLKRGGLEEKVPLKEAGNIYAPVESESIDLVALDAALERLAQDYPRQCQVVEMRFFAGLDSGAIAEMLQLSEKTVLRDWQFVKVWLYRELDHGKP